MPHSNFIFQALAVHLKGSLILITICLLLGADPQAQTGLKAEYYDGTNFDRLATVKYVPNIDQYWNRHPPVPGINPHRCSIRWTGKLKPGKSGTYKFAARVDDGIRVWVDDRLIIDQWSLNDVGIFQGTVDLVAHQTYDLKVEYFNALVEGEVRLLWKIPNVKRSWYDRLFGDEDGFKVIAPEYFIRPEESKQNEGELIVYNNNNANNTPARQNSDVSQSKQENVSKKRKQNKPTKQANNNEIPEVPKTVVSVKEAEQYIPKNIEFERAKTIILQSSYKELNSFANFMLDHPHLKVKIEGHTDPVGDAEMNLQLSKRRAKTVARYLVNKGIDSRRIKAEGYGGSQPLVVPEAGKYYPANRRVVFIVSGLKG